MPFEVVADAEAKQVWKLNSDGEDWEQAVQGVDYATYYYDGAKRAANGNTSYNWTTKSSDTGTLGQVIRFVDDSNYTYKFIAIDALTALTKGHQCELQYEEANIDDDKGWNMQTAGRTYTTIPDAPTGQEVYFQLYNDKDDSFTVCNYGTENGISIAPSDVYVVQLIEDNISGSEINSVTSDNSSVEFYSFELIDADGEMLDRIYIADGSNQSKYILGKISSASTVPQMSINIDGASYCAYSSLASTTDKSYDVKLSDLYNDCKIVMTKAGTQTVSINNTATTLDSAIDVTDGIITITIGSQTTSVNDIIRTTKVYAINGAIVITGAEAGDKYTITNMSAIPISGVTEADETKVAMTKGIYVVNIAGKTYKVAVK
ncbi:MAG: hypothetical protein R3Y22_03710 [Bacteroidales bacterium]